MRSSRPTVMPTCPVPRTVVPAGGVEVARVESRIGFAAFAPFSTSASKGCKRLHDIGTVDGSRPAFLPPPSANLATSGEKR